MEPGSASPHKNMRDERVSKKRKHFGNVRLVCQANSALQGDSSITRVTVTTLLFDAQMSQQYLGLSLRRI